MKGNDLWGKVESGLAMAKYIGILDTCTCKDPIIIDWKGDLCGHCQILEAMEALHELRTNRNLAVRLTQFRLTAEDEAETSIMDIETSMALVLADVCEALGLDQEDIYKVLGTEAYAYAYELPVFQRENERERARTEELLTKLRELPSVKAGHIVLNCP